MKSRTQGLLDQYKEKLVALLGYDPDKPLQKEVTPVIVKKLQLSLAEKLKRIKEWDRNIPEEPKDEPEKKIEEVEEDDENELQDLLKRKRQ